MKKITNVTKRGSKVSDLRVLAGIFKGVKLKTPQNGATHPMGSREKLALFNMIQAYVPGAIVLDAYAGSGALGIEALSRGAAEVSLVESDRRACEAIQQNIGTVLQRYAAKSAVGDENFRIDLYPEKITETARRRDFKGYFSLILADPPYDGFDVVEVAKIAKLLQTGGILALSFPFEAGAPEIPGLVLLTQRKYARAGIAIYCKK